MKMPSDIQLVVEQQEIHDRIFSTTLWIEGGPDVELSEVGGLYHAHLEHQVV